MQTATRKGRPPASAQTMPAFLKAAISRTTRELPMSATTAKAVDEYIDWSSAKANLPKHEALYKFADHVLSDFIRRDSLYQAERNGRGPSGATEPEPAMLSREPAGPGVPAPTAAVAHRSERTAPVAPAPARIDARPGAAPAATTGKGA